MIRDPSFQRCRASLAAATAWILLLAGTAQAAPPVTVAFIGDQGSGRAARAVLRMIRAQGADMVLHQGDLDYDDDPEAWDRMITEILGEDFPYFASVGNHDDEHWYGPRGYQAKLQARLDRVPGADCDGDLGVMSACTYKGLFFILSGAGTIPDDVADHPRHVAYLAERLSGTDATWRICSWHKNQRRMQVGKKDNDVGWAPYETCREGGAIVATGHDHTYARTHLMDRFETQSVASTSSTLVIEKGKSFAFVSGLGGKSIRKQKRGGGWWAAIYTENQGANYGALFCTFNANGDPERAECHFRDIEGRVPDRFRLVNRVEVGTEVSRQP